ncbi:MAG: 1-deoxy-D-xylulose-5-phosphate reductoisomerase [Candidatus Omnitrophica bacterium]|nr:1-deoxy-D-xylulose-5-phosphate reductoisomerase [Candidatus Omnitrophota bacterium]
MRRIGILGSTGSIGKNALLVAERLPGEFKVTAVSANSNTKLLYEQVKRCKASLVALADSEKAGELKNRLGGGVKVLSGPEGLNSLIEDKSVEYVLIAISGASALAPIMRAIECRKNIALANKEALVMAGPLIMEKARRNKVSIIPIDSEQSAIWQCLEANPAQAFRKLILTASGGPLRKINASRLKSVSVSDCLRHPRWKMGKKITIDSATMMNKGLEVIEAMRLFDVGVSQVEVLIHPEAVIHSMVEFVDGVVMAQLSITDMRIPIQYALSYPRRLANDLPGVDFCKLGNLSFEKPDFKKFPCLGLAYRAAKCSGTMPAVLNAADEIAVEAFIGSKLGFISIAKVIEKVMDNHKNVKKPALDDILEADRWARGYARKIIGA